MFYVNLMYIDPFKLNFRYFPSGSYWIPKKTQKKDQENQINLPQCLHIESDG